MKTILVVDDEAAIVRLVCGILSAVDFRTLSASDVTGAQLHLCLGPQVDAIVTDYQLPDGTGLDLLAWLRQRGGPILPTVLMSGGWIPDDSETDFAGCEFLPKPFLSVDLLAALQRAFEGVSRAPRLTPAFH